MREVKVQQGQWPEEAVEESRRAREAVTSELNDSARAVLFDLEAAKRKRLVDLIRRAAANGTWEEVVDAILPDWHPLVRVRSDGKIEILGQVVS